MVQVGQGLGEGGDIGAMEAGRAEQDLDPAVQHILGQPVPEVEHRRPAAMVGVDAGAAKFQKLAARGEERGQVELGLGIEAPGGGATVAGQDAVGADDMVAGRRVDAAVDQDQVVEERVKGVALQPRWRGRPAGRRRQVRARRPDSEALRGGQVVGRCRQPHGVGGVFGGHLHLWARTAAGLVAGLT